MKLRWMPGLGILAVVLGMGAFPCRGDEPDGRLVIRHEWAGDRMSAFPAPSGPAPGDSAILRVRVHGLTSLSGVRIRLDAPPGIEVEPLTVPGPSFPPGPWPVLQWRITSPATGGGILSFRVDGIDGDSNVVSEGEGIPVGSPGTEPRSRFGALEFGGSP